MTINCCEVCLAVFICSIITIVIYIASWYNHEEKEENESKEVGTSNLQGLDNDKPIPRGELNETLTFNVERRESISSENRSTGEIIKEKSDLWRLQDEHLRSRIDEIESGDHHITHDYVQIERKDTIHEYDPVVHPDAKPGRINLSIRYDDERSKLIVGILDAQGLIRPEQIHSPEMCVIFTLIGPYINDDEVEKHTRIVVENAAIGWKEPMAFCITFENATKQNLYVNLTNKTDPSSPRDREISIPLNNLGSQGEEINEWYDLQFVQSSY